LNCTRTRLQNPSSSTVETKIRVGFRHAASRFRRDKTGAIRLDLFGQFRLARIAKSLPNITVKTCNDRRWNRGKGSRGAI
jgi:hypothetical protein